MTNLPPDHNSPEILPPERHETRTSANAARKPRGRSRKSILLGAVALGALATAGVMGGVILPPHQPAAAQSGPAKNLTEAVAPQSSFADIVEKVKPAVVSVRVKIEEDDTPSNGLTMRQFREQFGIEPGSPMERFFRQFGEENGMGGDGMHHPQPRHHFGEAQGSGFFITKDGYIVTNNHVVEKSKSVEVVTDDGKTLKAKVIGTDPKTDVALLKTENDGPFPFVTFAPKEPRIGDWVIAVGNPFGLGGTVTAGIVSARGRDIGAGPYDDFIQIDAPVNKGNSGGPTFNTSGEVVGINTAIASPSGGSVGIAFAIPAETAQHVVQQIRDKGFVQRGYLGVQIQPVTRDIADSIGLDKAEGALVARVEPDTPAGQAGVKSGDVITKLNGQPVKDARTLSREVASLDPGKQATITVLRGGKAQDFSVKLATLPGGKEASADKAGDDQSADLGKLGLQLAPADSVSGIKGKGVAVVGVEPGSQADDKGLKTGDVIAEVSGQAVRTPADIRQAIAQSRKDGKKAVLFRIERGDASRFVALPIGKAG